MSEQQINRNSLLTPLFLFLVTIATRIPFTSRFLYHYDSCHFALALKKYDLAIHQPHPPGYFLYVMLGRLINIVIDDSNTIFVSISVFFSALTVVAIYSLGKELYQGNTALLAAALAVTSPNLWCHGEVALTYVVEAFFSTLIAIFCYRIMKGKQDYFWLAAVTLGIAGGIRQNTPVFLFPLWLYAMKDLPLRKIIVSLGVFILVSLSWFIPMIWMTGGWDRYQNAFKELWLFNTGHNSVFERGWSAFHLYSSTIFRFVIYGVGAGLPVLGLTAYLLIKGRKTEFIDKRRFIFFSLWVIPSVLFYLLVFIQPNNPGYSLVFLPALLILTAAATEFLANRSKRFNHKYFRNILSAALIVTNAIFFLFLNNPVSFYEIREHDRTLSALLDSLRVFNPSKTVVFATADLFYGFRHIMYYLPEYEVYQIDMRTARTGEIRKTFRGVHGETFLTSEIALPANITSFATLIIGEKNRIYGTDALTTREVVPSIYLVSGSLQLLNKVYPELRLMSQPVETR